MLLKIYLVKTLDKFSKNFCKILYLKSAQFKENRVNLKSFSRDNHILKVKDASKCC